MAWIEDTGRWLGASSLALLFATWVPACAGSVSPGPDGDGTPVPIEALPERLANAACENIAGCCNSSAIAFDLATCRATAKAALQKAVNQETSLSVRYDASAAGACIAAYGAYFKGCVDGDEKSIEADCSQVFVGTVAVGGACTNNQDCAPSAAGSGSCVHDTTGDTTGQSNGGVCVAAVNSSSPAIVHGKLGEACVGSCSGSGDCAGPAPSGPSPSVTALCFTEDGLQCEFRTQTCQPFAALGEPCNFGGCVAGAFCSNTSACSATKPDGAVCASNEECTGRRCLFAETDALQTSGVCGAKGLATPAKCSGNLDD